MATVEEIKRDIIDWVNADTGSNLSYDKFPSAFSEFLDTLAWRNAEIELASGTVKTVEFTDAGEGDYSADTVLVFSVGQQLFRVDGHYESWAGNEWESNDMYEVQPVQVMVTEYQRKVI